MKLHSHLTKTLCLALFISLFAVSNSFGQKAPKEKKSKSKKGAVAAPVAIKSFNDSISYAIGVVLSESFKQQGLDSLNVDLLSAAIKASLAKQPTALSTEKANEMLQAMSMKKMEEQNKKKETETSANKKVGQDWLEKNGKRPGVITLPSGLQYEVVKEGMGAKPTLENKVTCHYKGTLIDGTVFDSSYDRGEPVTFPLNGVIKGWQEGVGLMTPGAKYKLYIPSDLGYGEAGAGGVIPGNAALIFEVELISIQ